MKGIAAFSAVCAVTSTANASAVEKRSTITPITTSGNAFWAGNERFYIRGVDYQPGGSSKIADPIADAENCLRDVKMFKQLGINTVRVYTVDNSADHDTCMNALANAGIYLALDVNSPLYSLNREDPAPSYNDVYLQNVFATIDAFASYPNTLLFFSGNEVISNSTNTNTAPYIKAVTRDMKDYIRAQSPRQIPVGYSAADVSENREQTAAYMNCGSDGMARSDFFAFNDYSYCSTNFVESGWDEKVQTYRGYSIPLFLSEFGCNQNPPRTFTEWHWLMSPKMTPVYSGGLVYEYTEELDPPDYGLVKVSGNSVQPLSDFSTMQKELAANPAPSGAAGFQQNNPISSCPASSPMWKVFTEALPAIPTLAEKYLKQGAGAGVGLKGKGSQTAGTPSKGFVNVKRPGVKEKPASPVSTTSGNNGGSTNAAGSLKQGLLAPVACAAVVIASSLISSVVF